MTTTINCPVACTLLWLALLGPAIADEPEATGGTSSTLIHDRGLALGQGTMAGEIGDSSALLQTRLTRGTTLDGDGDLPGGAGVAGFEWSLENDFGDSQQTPLRAATPDRDFIVRVELFGLQSDTPHYYRAIFGPSESNLTVGPTCSFRTLPGREIARPVKFIVGSCMNYMKFMHGKAGKASGPVTATEEDRRLGFPAFESMKTLHPEFFVGTGDIVYYDNPLRVAKSAEEMRRCWHEQFRFPRLINFFQTVPTYWSKDDHDFRFNDSDLKSKKLPLAETGIGMFHEQLPIVSTDDPFPRTYRTIRVSRDLQIWLTEGRDFRSANSSPDGPEKSLWGPSQRRWLKETLSSSDARWKLIISPTPMVGPDDGYKKDNHANLQGFRYEADQFFEWVQERQIENLVLICGDRHWQYHSIHPSGVHELACGALNDENSRMGVRPGAKNGSDPDGLVRQLYTSPDPSGGFLQIFAGQTLEATFFDDHAKVRYHVAFP